MDEVPEEHVFLSQNYSSFFTSVFYAIYFDNKNIKTDQISCVCALWMTHWRHCDVRNVFALATLSRMCGLKIKPI